MPALRREPRPHRRSELNSPGWSGIWIEASKRNIRQIRKELRPLIDERKLTVLAQFITRDNIVAHLEGCSLPHDPDLVSIDIDGNDYWVWEALLSRYAPRVVIVEYNALLGPSAPWVMEYNPAHARERVIATSYYGASLKALEMLGRRKGYSLVGCDFLGVNAFFVRNDLLEDRFCAPYTSENHFEPNRLFLYRRNGPPRKIGRFVVPSSDAVGRGDTLTRLPEGERVEPMAPRRRASSVRV